MHARDIPLSPIQQALWLRCAITGCDLTIEFRVDVPDVAPATVVRRINRLLVATPLLEATYGPGAQGYPLGRPGTATVTTMAAGTPDKALLREMLWSPAELRTKPAIFVVQRCDRGSTVFASISHLVADSFSLGLIATWIRSGIGALPQPRGDHDWARDHLAARPEIQPVDQSWFPDWGPRGEDGVRVKVPLELDIRTLARAARRFGATPSMLFIACYALALGDAARSSAVPIAFPWNGRGSGPQSHVIGALASIRYVRADFACSATFQNLVEQIRRQVIRSVRSELNPCTVGEQNDTQFLDRGQWWVGRVPVPSFDIEYERDRAEDYEVLYLSDDDNERRPLTDFTLNVRVARTGGIVLDGRPGPRMDRWTARRILERVAELIRFVETAGTAELDGAVRQGSLRGKRQPPPVSAAELSRRLSTAISDQPSTPGWMVVSCAGEPECRTSEAGLLARAFRSCAREELLPLRIQVEHVCPQMEARLPRCTPQPDRLGTLDLAAAFHRFNRSGRRAPLGVFRREPTSDGMTLSLDVAREFDELDPAGNQERPGGVDADQIHISAICRRVTC